MTAKKDNRPIVAIMYDFDNTLSTKDMQEYTFIPSLGESAKSFWEMTNEIARKDQMDKILAYMYLMVRLSRDKHMPISKEIFRKAGEGIKLFPGVEGWFERINKFGDENGVKIEHFVISSGLREIIEGNRISKEFKAIFACEFHYDENKVADWPSVAVNYTNKTQFLFRINKGIYDITNDREINRYIPDDRRPVPFRNMIYIGDGMTDVPCMKLVKVNGGQSIAVYKKSSKDLAKQLLDDNRVDHIAKANYEEGKELDLLVKDIIIRDAAAAKLLNRKS